VSNAAAREILIDGARTLAHIEDLGASLDILLGSLAEQLEIGSAAIFVVSQPPGRLDIAATAGLGDPAIAGLTAAVASPGHPIATTVVVPVASFDVLPTAPGGPALRSHLPLIVTRGGEDIVLGVLALAHDHPIDPETRPLLEASANLAAVAIEGRRLRA
jgi:GAF domain-containing protein